MKLNRIFTVVIIVAFSSSIGLAQYGSQYTVNQSAATVTSPIQAAPGPDAWKLQQRLSQLSTLQQEILQYEAALNLTNIQQAVNDAQNNWWTQTQSVFDVYDAGQHVVTGEPMDMTPGTATPDGLGDRPDWQDAPILDIHLSSLLHAINFDANRLGLESNEITSSAWLDRANSLDQLKSRVDTEITALNATIANGTNRRPSNSSSPILSLGTPVGVKTRYRALGSTAAVATNVSGNSGRNPCSALLQQFLQASSAEVSCAKRSSACIDLCIQTYYSGNRDLFGTRTAACEATCPKCDSESTTSINAEAADGKCTSQYASAQP